MFKPKKILSLLVIVLIGLTACTPGTGGTPTPTPTPNQQIVLKWWNLFEPKENIQPLIDAYKTSNPNVEIQYTQIDSTTTTAAQVDVAGYKKQLDAVLQNTDPLDNPDIFTIENTWEGIYEQFISKAPSNIFSNDDLSDFYPFVLADFNKNGLAGLPLYVDTLVIIYNKDKLAAKGYTSPSSDWTDFQTQANALTIKDSQNRIVNSGFSANEISNTEFQVELFNLLMLQNNVQILDTSGTKAIFTESDDFSRTVDFYSKLGNTWSKSSKKDISSFLEKKLAMYAAPSWRLINVLNYNKQFNLGLNVGVAEVPQLGGGNKKFWPTYWAQTVSKDSIHKEEAWKFIKFLTQSEQLKQLNDTVIKNGRPIGIIYPRASLKNSIDLTIDEKQQDGTTKKINYSTVFANSLSGASNWTMYDGNKVKTAFTNAFSGSISFQDAQSLITNVLTNKDAKP